MAEHTTNYDLIKPTTIENALINDINDNMDIIDGQMYQNAQDIQENTQAIQENAEAIQEVDGKFTGVETKTLLWTNANPSSAFEPQTLSLNLSDYDFVEIECNFSDQQTGPSNIIKVAVGKNCWLHVDGFDLNQTTAVGVMNDAFRYVTTTQSGITFNSGNQRYNSNLYKDWNIRCIPQKIYGIKKEVA